MNPSTLQAVLEVLAYSTTDWATVVLYYVLVILSELLPKPPGKQITQEERIAGTLVVVAIGLIPFVNLFIWSIPMVLSFYQLRRLPKTA